MKRIAVILSALSLLSCTGVGNRAATVSGTVVDISPAAFADGLADTIDLGRVRAGEIILMDVVLRNAGAEPMAIVGVESGCGCVDTDVPYRPVKPGEDAPMTVRFYSGGLHGPQIKSVTLSGTSGTGRRIVLLADVE